MHARALAAKSCGAWQPMHESWAAGCGCAASAWHDAHPAGATDAGWCARWQSRQPLELRMVGVLRRALGVAAGAIRRGDGRAVVQAVALRTVDRRVLHHGRQITLPKGVATDAGRRGAPGREDVAGEAVGRAGPLTAVVAERRFLGMAGRADGRARILEAVPLEVVAVPTGGLPPTDVRHVPRRSCGTRPTTPERRRAQRRAARAARASRAPRTRPGPASAPTRPQTTRRSRRVAASSTHPVTETARQVVVLVLAAGEARAMRVAARAADAMAADAELLARAAVAAGARRRIRCAPARRALRLPSPAGAGYVPSAPATFSRVWQSMQELSVWQVVQRPGSARASSA